MEKSKRRFTKNMSLPLNKVCKEEENFTSERNISKWGERCSEILEEELLPYIKVAEQVVITEYLTVESVIV